MVKLTKEDLRHVQDALINAGWQQHPYSITDLEGRTRVVLQAFLDGKAADIEAEVQANLQATEEASEGPPITSEKAVTVFMAALSKFAYSCHIESEPMSLEHTSYDSNTKTTLYNYQSDPTVEVKVYRGQIRALVEFIKNHKLLS